jgi:hypothetical protein
LRIHDLPEAPATGEHSAYCYAGFILDSRANNFERGRCDEFLIQARDLGEIFKLFLSSDGAGLAADWHLSQIVVTNCVSQVTTTFPFDGWFSVKAGLQHVRANSSLSPLGAPEAPLILEVRVCVTA